ncbi:hypothetical protein Bca4012_027974 [Brassica carinata]
MITRSKLAEQLREYQIKSKHHDWASVSFFSSSSNFSSSSSRLETVVLTTTYGYFIIQGGCGSVCHLGTSDLSLPGVFGCLLVLQAVGTRVHLCLCLFTVARLYENYEASENS